MVSRPVLPRERLRPALRSFGCNNPFLIQNLSGAANPDGIFYSQRGILNTESTAVYGQVDWDLTDRLSLSMGLRYSEDDKAGQESQTIFYDSVLDFCGEGRLPELIASGDPYFTPPGCFRLGVLVSDLKMTTRKVGALRIFG